MEVIYELKFSPKALEDIRLHKKSGNKAIQKKISNLLAEMQRHPKEGTGQCEELKYNLSGYWSRRINKEHRIVYEINEETKTVYISRMAGHY